MTALARPSAFFAHLRDGILGPTLSPGEVAGCEAITDAVGEADWPLSHAAYGLATAYHETAHSMQPIKEFGGDAYLFRMYSPDGMRRKLAEANGNTEREDWRYFGRGYVQLTWKSNYKKAGAALGIGLVASPDLALRDDIAAKIMVLGMSRGWFTGKRCATYLPMTGPADKKQFTDARRIINGTDKAILISGYALEFQTALRIGGWA